MLMIKTITENYPHLLDRAVNEALAEGWELVRRECFITGSDRATTFYAELEKETEEAEYEDDTARWELARDPAYPYRCTGCGCKSHKPIDYCPNCKRIMIGTEE